MGLQNPDHGPLVLNALGMEANVKPVAALTEAGEEDNPQHRDVASTGGPSWYKKGFGDLAIQKRGFGVEERLLREKKVDGIRRAVLKAKGASELDWKSARQLPRAASRVGGGREGSGG